MPPPHLQNISSARAYSGNNQALTPRTPHSRAGRAEEAFTDVELEQFGDDEYRAYSDVQQQSEPLLASSASATFPPSGIRARGDDVHPRDKQKARTSGRIFQWLITHAGLVLGALVAIFLFFMIILSLKRPDTLLRAIGEKNATVSEGSSTAHTEQDTTKITDPTQEFSINDTNIISYANYTHFPLRPDEYHAECQKLMGGFMPPRPYWWGEKDVLHHSDPDSDTYPSPEGERTQVCSSTITYMLDGYVGLSADLALMAQAAALAREKNRTFLVDDTYWNRGKWIDYFQDVRARQPGPEPGCRAPPPEELVACPRTARHWVINSRTAKWHFGHGFSENYEDAYARQLNRLKVIYERARESLQHTIRPNAATALLIRSVRAEFASLLPNSTSGLSSSDVGRYIAVHIRRGDRYGLSWKYHGKYIPIEDYAEATSSTWSRLFLDPDLPPSSHPPSPVVYLAFDDPTTQENYRAQLPADTTLFSLVESVDGELRALSSPIAYVQKEFDALWEAERAKRTRGMIVDFAMIGGFWNWESEGNIVPGAVVCTIGSNVCRLSATGLGWDRAFGHVFGDHVEGNIDEQYKRWVEIDEKGAVEPVWQAFELFN